MQVLMLSNFYFPHVGGVEKHIREISKIFSSKKIKVRLITLKYNSKLKEKEKVDNVNVLRIDYPKIKFIGILAIWFQLLKNIKLISESDIVHIHDVFVWFLPFRLFFPRKKVYITHHGGQANFPISKKEIIMKKIASKLANGTICIGRFIPKYFKISSDVISYGAANIPKKVKKEKRVVWVGRLEKETDILKALKKMEKYKRRGYKIDFCGDGPLRNKCERIGKVHGYVNPTPFLGKAKICFPVGYLSALEAMASKCKVKVVWTNKLKEDYWKLTPLWNFISSEDISGAYKWATKQTWGKLAGSYIKLWKN